MSRFLANENIARASVELLRKNGLDVLWVSEWGPSTTDELVLEIARREGRVVITYDSDYGEMIFSRQLPRPLGIVFLRLRSRNETDPAKIVLSYLDEDPDIFENRFSVITENGIRYKKL